MKAHAEVSPLTRATLAFIALLVFAAAAGAGTYGDFTYELINGGTEVEITDYPTSASGHVDIPAQIESTPVTSIGDSAFYHCTGLTSVTIPEGVTAIGDGAFRYCHRLTGITIPEGVTAIGDYAFAGCTGLTGVIIPEGVSTIGDGALSECTGLTGIDVGPGNAHFASVGGVLFDAAHSTLVAYPAGLSGQYSIPEGVTAIGDYAFAGCNGLTGVTIPEGVTTIGDGAFSGCDGLTGVTIPEGVTAIGDYAFAVCTGLTGVTIGNSVTSIGDEAFSSCYRLAGVTIGNGVTSIGDYAFFSCGGLTGIDVDPGNVHFASVGGVLFDAAHFTLIAYPAGLSGQYSIPEGVTTIGDGAFSGCGGLTGVTLPEGVTTIGEGAFYGCRGLTGITIPGNVTSIGGGAFRYCDSLTGIGVDPGNSHYGSVGGVLFDAGQTTLVAYPGGLSGAYTIPQGVTNIGGGAFQACDGLTGITIPGSVTSIGDYAFQSCYRLTRAYFAGDAPGAFGSGVFPYVADGVSVFYLDTAAGFSSPIWNGYPAEEMDTTAYPDARWLITHSIHYDTDMGSDLNGDSITLFTAYALDLGPRDILAPLMPAAAPKGGMLEMEFYAGRADVTYRAQTSTDSADWTETGVTLSPPDVEGRRTASVLTDAPARFMRLLMER